FRAIGISGAEDVGHAIDPFCILDRNGSSIVTVHAPKLAKLGRRGSLEAPKHEIDEAVWQSRSSYAVHRAELHRWLVDQLPPGILHTGKRCISFSQSEKNVRLYFEDGSLAEADYLLAADGIHSMVRRTLVPESSSPLRPM